MFNTYTYEGCFVECIARLTKNTCSCIQIGSIPDVSRIPQDVREVYIVEKSLSASLGTVSTVNGDRLRAAASASEQHGLPMGNVRHHQ